MRNHKHSRRFPVKQNASISSRRRQFSFLLFYIFSVEWYWKHWRTVRKGLSFFFSLFSFLSIFPYSSTFPISLCLSLTHTHSHSYIHTHTHTHTFTQLHTHTHTASGSHKLLFSPQMSLSSFCLSLSLAVSTAFLVLSLPIPRDWPELRCPPYRPTGSAFSGEGRWRPYKTAVNILEQFIGAQTCLESHLFFLSAARPYHQNWHQSPSGIALG